MTVAAWRVRWAGGALCGLVEHALAKRSCTPYPFSEFKEVMLPCSLKSSEYLLSQRNARQS